MSQLTNKSIIYCILNKTDGKFYIGSAVNYTYRWRQHKHELASGSHKNPYLQHAYNKHWGSINFEFMIIEHVANKENLLVREQWWFDITHCWKPEIGYNICSVAGSMIGTTQTKEHIAKRNRNRSFVVSEETKQQISIANKGRKLTIETRKKMSDAKKGKQYRLGTKTSDETKKKLSEAGKGRPMSENTKRKLLESKLGKPRSEETKQKLRLSALKQWEKFKETKTGNFNG